MKNAKKIGIVLMLVAVITALVVICAFAVDSVYTGSAIRFGNYVNKANNAKNAPEEEFDFDYFLEKLEKAYTYLEEKPVDPEEEGYAEARALYLELICYTADKYLDDAAKATNSTEKSDNITEATLWLERGFVTDEERETDAYTSRATKISSANLDLAKALHKELGEKVGEEINSADTQTYISAGAKIKRLYAFITKGSFDTKNTDYQTILADAVELMAVYNAKMEEKRQELIWQADFDEYGQPYGFVSAFETPSAKTPGKANWNGVDENGASLVVQCVRESEIIGYDEKGNAITNGYYTLRNPGAINASNGKYLTPYFNFTYTAASGGMVYELDLTTFGKLTASIGVQPFSGSSWMNITKDGKIGIYYAKDKATYVNDGIVPGAWTHISYVYDRNDLANCKLYVDYALVGTGHGDIGNKGTVPKELRFGNSANVNGEFSIDNVRFTPGTSFRDENFFDNFENHDFFNYYVEYMNYTKGEKDYIDIADCVAAYDLAGQYIDLFAEEATDADEANGSYVVRILNEETPDPNDYLEVTKYYKYKQQPANIDDLLLAKLKASVDSYYKYDADSIIDAHKKDNLAKLKTLADAIMAQIAVTEATSAAIAKLNSAYAAYEKFVALNSKYIYDDSADENSQGVYNYCNQAFAEAADRIATDTLFLKYINAMNSFLSTTNLASMEKYLAEAEAIIEEGAPFSKYISDEYTSRESYATLKKHYTVTRLNAPKQLEGTAAKNASKRIIDFVNYLAIKYPTEEQWRLQYIDKPEDQLTDIEKQNNADFEFISEYLALIRKLTRGDYDESFVNDAGDSVAYSIERIAPMNEHYYSLLQDKHYVTIKDALDQCSASNSYIEKKGLLAWVERYLVENEVDYTASYHCDNCGDMAGILASLANPVCPVCGASVEVVNITSSHELLNNVLQRYLAYNLELDEQVGGYEDLLAENTAFFIDYVKMLNTALTYVEMKEIYDLATPYYDVMNVSSDEAKAAIAVYDSFTAKLKVVEDASEKFKECMLYLDVCEEKRDIFNCLVEAKIAQENYDTSIDGVAEALVKFNAARENYDSKVAAANKQISESGYALGSMASNCDLAAIISVIIEKLFNFG